MASFVTNGLLGGSDNQKSEDKDTTNQQISFSLNGLSASSNKSADSPSLSLNKAMTTTVSETLPGALNHLFYIL
jgi:hypothetical protein